MSNKSSQPNDCSACSMGIPIKKMIMQRLHGWFVSGQSLIFFDGANVSYDPKTEFEPFHEWIEPPPWVATSYVMDPDSFNCLLDHYNPPAYEVSDIMYNHGQEVIDMVRTKYPDTMTPLADCVTWDDIQLFYLKTALRVWHTEVCTRMNSLTWRPHNK